MPDKNSTEYKIAERTVEKKMGFYKHLIIYLIVNIILLITLPCFTIGKFVSLINFKEIFQKSCL